jgi:branched-chain amino acid aminotransferase
VIPSIWINGARSTGEQQVSARDRGLTLADGAFETMHARRGVIFRLERHLARLAHALQVLSIDAPAALREWLLGAVSDIDGDDAGVRLTVTRGFSPTGGVVLPATVSPTVIVAINPPPAFSPALYERGVSAHVASGRRNEHAMTAGLKTLAFTDGVVAMIEARRAGADDALFLDTEGHCSEATTSNLFMFRGGTLVTPPLSCAALPGITRATVLELARDGGMPTEERAFRLGELLAADEAFLTSSLRGLVPLVRVGDQAIGAGLPGDVTRRLASHYTALVDRECGA